MEVVIECHCDLTQPGDQLCISGSGRVFGEWQPDKALELSTSADRFPLWYSPPVRIQAPLNDVEFKFIIKRNNEHLWESCDNRRFSANTSNDSELSRLATVRCTYNIKDSSVLASSHRGTQNDSPVDTHLADPCMLHLDTDLSELEQAVKGGTQLLDRIVQTEMNGGCKSLRLKLGLCKTLMETHLTPLLEHETNVTNACDCFFPPRSGHKEDGSEDSLNKEILGAVEVMPTVALYLGEVTVQNIQCQEDGQHYRPCSHANESKQLSIMIRRLIGLLNCRLTSTCAIGLSPSQNHRAMNAASIFEVFGRAIIPMLTSFEPQFTTAQPLTRIRDIAHRNDIDQGLKSEIKMKLQNKLHRCAGMEDLTTCEEFLQRFESNPGMVNDDFLHQFRIFHGELREFFMATGTVEKLGKFATSFNHLHEIISQFIPGLTTSDADLCCQSISELCSILSRTPLHNGSLATVLDMLQTALVQTVRSRKLLLDLSYAISTATELADHDELQVFAHLCISIDIGVEAQVFSILSTVENLFARVPVESFADDLLDRLVSALAISLDHSALSGVARNDTESLARALENWSGNHRGGDSQSKVVNQERTLFMMLRGLLKRVQAVSEAYASSIVVCSQPLANHISLIGSAVLKDSDRVKIYAEGFVRSSIIFQATKLNAIAKEYLRKTVNEGLFDTLVPGSCRGYILGASSLLAIEQYEQHNEDEFEPSLKAISNFAPVDVMSLQSTSTESNAKDLGGTSIPIILWVTMVDGDEELGGISSRLQRLVESVTKTSLPCPITITGIIVDHQVPSLSHLGVRARALSIPFAAIYDASVGKSLKIKWSNTLVQVDFTSTCDEPFLDAIHLPESIAIAHVQKRSDQIKNIAPNTVDRMTVDFSQPETIALSTTKSLSFFPLHGGRWSHNQMGLKAMKCRDLMLICRDNLELVNTKFEAPSCVGLPFMSFDELVAAYGPAKLTQLLSTYEAIKCNALVEEWARDVRDAIEDLSELIPSEVQHRIVQSIAAPLFKEQNKQDSMTIMIRSSANCEDLSSVQTGAGLFDSYPVTLTTDVKDGQVLGQHSSQGSKHLAFDNNSVKQFFIVLIKVMASLYSTRAVRTVMNTENENRNGSELTVTGNDGAEQIKMAVLFQPVIGPPSICFVLHTVAPYTSMPEELHSISPHPNDWVYAELAHGMGEILASAKYAGSPYSMFISKKRNNRGVLTGYYHVINATSFAVQIVPPADNSHTLSSCLALNKTHEHPYFNCSSVRDSYALALAELSCELEKFYGEPQDIEGFFGASESQKAAPEVYVVQSRPQPILSSTWLPQPDIQQ